MEGININVSDKLDKLIDNTTKLFNYSLLLSSDNADFTTNLNPAIQLDDDRWAIGLIDLETYNSIPNITTINNIFKYSIDNGAIWKTITLIVGSYEITDINSEIQRLMTINGDSGITISANTTTLGSIIDITPATYKVDFTVPNSIGATLGFTPIVLSTGYNISSNIVNILTISSIVVNCSIVKNSYLGGVQFPVLYSFSPNVSPGYKIVQSPINIIYLPVSSNQISSIRIWITDQNGKPIDFRNETISCRLHLKHI